jgi:ATP-binding protein involved in chromosome partitioning
MDKIEQLIKNLQNIIFKESEFDLKDLPIQFYQNDDKGLILKTGFPNQWFREITRQYALDSQIDWQTDIKAHLTQLPGFGIRNIKNAIAVASGKGGVGKSTVSTNLACATARLGANVGLLDADIYGPSIPTMMGISDHPACTEDNRYIPLNNHAIHCMSMGFLQTEGPFIWRGPMLAKALMEMINQTVWPELDYLFIDLPPGTGDIPLSLTQKIPLSGAVIVTTPQTIATLDAEKAIQMFIKLNIPIIGIISNMAWHECKNCHHHSYIFGDTGTKQLADKYQIPVLGELPLDDSIRQHGDEGQPIAIDASSELSMIWQKIALQMSVLLSKQPINKSSKLPPVRTE